MSASLTSLLLFAICSGAPELEIVSWKHIPSFPSCCVTPEDKEVQDILADDVIDDLRLDSTNVVLEKKKTVKTPKGNKKVKKLQKNVKVRGGSAKSLLELLMHLCREWIETELFKKTDGFAFLLTPPELVGDPSQLNKGKKPNKDWPWNLVDGRVDKAFAGRLPHAISIVKDEYKFSTFVEKVLKNEFDVDKMPKFKAFMKSVIEKKDKIRRVMSEAGTLPSLMLTPKPKAQKKSGSSSEKISAKKKDANAEKEQEENVNSEKENEKQAAVPYQDSDDVENLTLDNQSDFLKAVKNALTNANRGLKSDEMKDSIEWMLDNDLVKVITFDEDRLGQLCTNGETPKKAGFLHSLMKKTSESGVELVQNVANEKNRKQKALLEKKFHLENQVEVQNRKKAGHQEMREAAEPAKKRKKSDTAETPSAKRARGSLKGSSRLKKHLENGNRMVSGCVKSNRVSF